MVGRCAICEGALKDDEITDSAGQPLGSHEQCVRGLSAGHATVVQVQDVLWTMDWGPDAKNRDGSSKEQFEQMFEEDRALAQLLLEEVVFRNTFWHEKDWPEDARKGSCFYVNCNDLFMWGCSDAEPLDLSDSAQLRNLYEFWIKDRKDGAAVWCMISRSIMPQRPYEKKIRDAGIWDLDAIQKEHGLRTNYDYCQLKLARIKYERYAQWDTENGRTPVSFDGGWWAKGWMPFVNANPDWETDAFKAVLKDAEASWLRENGYTRDGEAE